MLSVPDPAALTPVFRHDFQQHLGGNRGGYGSRALSGQTSQSDRANYAVKLGLWDATLVQAVHKAPVVIAAADEAGVAMAFTGMRHFRH